MVGRPKEPKGMWTDIILQAVNAHWKERHIPPTMDAIIEMTGVPSKSVVSYNLRKLVDLGEITLVDGKAVPTWVGKAVSKATLTNSTNMVQSANVESINQVEN